MTQNTPVSKTDENPGTDRRAFLRALYGSAPDDLYLELRCIHPETGEVRTLWGRMGDKRGLAAAMKGADKLNAEGYGVYFAPCLRKEKKGNADSAAWVPALWIDIDSTDTPNLEKLKAFNPAPSFIISSGGGWHAYWLLDEPFLLKDEAGRRKIAGILRGLFSALGGDPGYVKSVASVMRLPDSLNTKPDRDGAMVQVVDWHSDQRYALSSFDWLAVSPQSQNGHTLLFSTNGNGHRPLPPRTEGYLTSGAHNGSRNAELFAAACQLRDAGYSQSEAERELITRYVADGDGSENPASREKEARATIASAYRQPPREPIVAPKEHARQVVSQLVGQYQLDQKPERPTTQQIVEAVEACIHLNSVEWAEERQRLKAVCGDGLKISDIDRLYKEKKKAVERQHQQEYIDTESYLLLDGKIIYLSERILLRHTGEDRR